MSHTKETTSQTELISFGAPTETSANSRVSQQPHLPAQSKSESLLAEGNQANATRSVREDLNATPKGEEKYSRDELVTLGRSSKADLKFIRSLKHKELLEAIELSRINEKQYRTEMNRRRNLKKIKSNAIKDATKETDVQQQIEVVNDRGEVISEITYSSKQTKLSQQILQKPLTKASMIKIITHNPRGDFWKSKIMEYVENYPDYIFNERVNHHAYTTYSKGTVAFWEDLMFGSRRRRDKFIQLMDEPLRSNDEIAETQCYLQPPSEVSPIEAPYQLEAAEAMEWENSDEAFFWWDDSDIDSEYESEPILEEDEETYFGPGDYDEWNMFCHCCGEFEMFASLEMYLQHLATYCDDWTCPGCGKQHHCFLCAPQEDEAETQSNEPVLEETSSLAGEHNITFVEERETDSDATHVNSNVTSKDQNNDMSEVPWSRIDDVLGREIIITRDEWTETTSGQFLSLGLPQVLTNKPTFLRRQLEVFAFIRAGVQVRIQFNGNRFACGRLLFALLPPMFDEDTSNYNFQQSFNFPHVMIDAAVSNVGTLFVPFTHILSHFPVERGALENDSICTLGRLVGYVINPLQVGEGAVSTLTYTIYAKFVAPELHQTTWPISEFSFSDGILTQAAEREGLWKRIVGGGLSTALGAFLSKMTGGLATGIGSLISGLIFDYPHDPLPPNHFVNKAIGPVCYGAGVDHSTRLALTPVSATETNPQMLGSTDGDFDLKTLLSVPSYLTKFKWEEAKIPGEELFTMPVCPVYIPNDRESADGNKTARYLPTMLAYISRAFCYWRGSIVVRFQVVKTEFNNGRLLIAYLPHMNSEILPKVTPNDSLEYFNMANAVVVDIEEQKEFDIVLPFMSPRPWLRCDAFRTNSSYVKAASYQTEMTYIGESTCGYLKVIVLNKLTAPSNVPTDIEVNVLISAGDDYELAYPTTLAPLNITSFGLGSFGEYSEYPFVIGKNPTQVNQVNFSNQNWIKSVWYEGRRLYEAGKIERGKQFWYESTPKQYIGSTDIEVIKWAYNASLVAEYKNTASGETTVQYRFIDLLGNYGPEPTKEDIAETQGLEEYTTNRQKAPAQIIATKGMRTSEAAPSTISENAMNLQTILRRFYPIYNSYPIFNLVGYTMVSIPVNPSFTPVARDPIVSKKGKVLGESVPTNQIAWFVKLYTYWRGSLRYKITIDTSMYDVNVIHVPTECVDFQVVSGVQEVDITRFMAYAGEVQVAHLAGALEVSVPYASPYNQLFVDVHNKYYNSLCQNGTLFLFIRNKTSEQLATHVPKSFQIYMATDEDFVMNVLKAPPLLEEPQMIYGYCKDGGETAEGVVSPETVRNLGNKSMKLATPLSTGIKKVTMNAYPRVCVANPPPEAEAQMFSFFSNANKAVENVNKILDGDSLKNTIANVEVTSHKISEVIVESNIKETLQSLNESASKIDSLLSTAGSTAEKLTHAEAIAKYATLASEVVLCGAFIHHLQETLKDPCISNFLTLAIEFGAIIGLATSTTIQTYLVRVVDWAMKFQMPELPQTQALHEAATDFIDDNSGVICTVVAVLGTILYAYVFDALPDLDKIKSAIKSFFQGNEAETQVLGGVIKNAHFSLLGLSALEKVYNRILDLVQRFINWFLDRENPEVYLARATEGLKDRVLALIEELDFLDYEPNFITALEDPLVHNRFYALQHEVRDLTRQCTNTKVDQKVVMLLAECRKRSVELIKRLEKEQCTAEERYEPYVILLEGATGTGKTRIAKKFFDMIGDTMALSPWNRVFSKGIGDPYWSGYVNQPIVFWDEFGQGRKEDEISIPLFMTLIGDKPVKVNMAHVDDKGRAFTSQAIVMTSNVPFINYSAIRDNKAQKRRRNVVISMRFKKGYDEQYMRKAKFDEFPEWEHCIFSLKHSVTGVVLQDNMTMFEVMQHVKKDLEEHHANQIAKLASSVSAVIPRGVVPASLTPEQATILKREAEEARKKKLQDIDPDTEFWRRKYHEAVEKAAAEQPTEPDNVEDTPLVLVENPEVLEAEARSTASDYEILTRNIEPEFDSDLDTAEEIFDDIARTEMNFCEDLFVVDEDGLSPAEIWTARMWICAHEKLDQVKQWRAYKLMKGKLEKPASKLLKLAKSAFEYMKEILTNFWESNPRLCKVLGLLTLLSGVGLVMHLRKSKEPEIYDSGPSRAVRKFVMPEHYDHAPGRAALKRVLPEGSDDLATMEISDKVRKYVYPIKWCEESVANGAMNCIHIGGHLILAPYHFFARAVSGDWFHVSHRTKPVKIEFLPERMKRIGDKDWVIYDCGIRLETGKQLHHFFIDENNLGKCQKGMRCMLLTRSVHDEEIDRVSGRCLPQREFKYASPQGDRYVQSGWQHDLDTKPGHCGGPLLAMNNNVISPGKILGIHCAGYRDKPIGFAVLVTRQQIESLLAQCETQCDGIPVPPCVKRGIHETMRILPDGDFSIVGEMPAKLAPAQPQKTTLIKTPFHEQVVEEYGPAPKIPAKLKPFEVDGQRVSPLKKAIIKYGYETVPYPQRSLKKCERYLIQYLNDKCTAHTGKRIFSEKEAVNGLPGVENAEKMNFKSSPGWPYQMETTSPGKWHLFDEEGNIVDPKLKQRLAERHAAAKKGQRVPSIWRDCLKDELRPTEKVNAGKTRLFTIAPVDFTILTRQYFFDFIMAFYGAQGNDFFSAVGINPESCDWTRLYKWLAETSPEVFAGDYECFDGKEMPEIIMMICDVINAWYNDSPENQQARRVIFEEIIHTMQLCENTVYMTHQGNPSGNPLTTIINTLANLILIMLTWLELCPQFTLDDFFRWVRFIAYGDDNVASPSPHLHEIFNQNTVSAALAKHGIVYTTEAKDGASVAGLRPLDEVTFLKRGFRRDLDFGKMFVLPVMSQQTLNSYFYYYRQSPDSQEQLQENMRSALLFAAFHGREFYNQYLSHWQKFMRNSGFIPLQISFEEQVDMFHYNAGMIEKPKKLTDRTEPRTSEGMEGFMNLTNNTLARVVGGVATAPFYCLAAVLGILRKDEHIVPTDDRWAVAIPSGEGKSYLAKQYPWLFVDHDDLLIPKFKESKTKLPWKSEVARRYDFPPEDRRVLLVHHPDNTNRRIVGSYITPFPTFIRMNCIQRLRLNNPTKVSRNDRNILLVQLCSKLEPSLVDKRTRSGLMAYPHDSTCLNQPVEGSTAENV